MLKKNKGITLIALAITIIVLLILVAVSISIAINGGLFSYARQGNEKTKNAISEEQNMASGSIKVGDTSYDSLDDVVNGEETRLPKEYQEVEYIESTGTQYIDTGVSGTFSEKIEFIGNFSLNDLKSGEQALIGSKNTSNQGLTLYFSSNSRTLGSWCGSGTGYATGNVVISEINSIDATFYKTKGRTITLNAGEYINNNISNNVTENLENFGLFSDKATAVSNSAYISLYDLQIIKDGVLIRDFVPCYRKSDFKPGLWDLVEGKFYTNQGTGEFNYPIEFEKGYQQVEFIESTGTQYIDTGFVPTANTTFYFDFMLIRQGSEPWNIIFGQRSNNAQLLVACDESSTTGDYGSSYAAFGNITSGASPLNNKVRIRTEIDEQNYLVYVDEINTGAVSTSVFNGTARYSILIFAFNNNGVIQTRNAYSRFYGNVKIWDNGALVRELVPCYRKTDSAIGMYDLVEKKFYMNAGTGTFEKGADV